MSVHSSGTGRAAERGLCVVLWLSVLLVGCGGGSAGRGTQAPPAAPAPQDNRSVEVARSEPASQSRPSETTGSSQQPSSSAASERTPADSHTLSGPSEPSFDPQDLRADARGPRTEERLIGPDGAGQAEEEAEEPSVLEEVTQSSIPDDYQLPRTREEILRATQSDLPLALNAEVIRMINYFTSRRGIRTLRATAERAAAYRPMIERILSEEGAPLELIHLAQAESGFRPKVRSWAGAVGMWQFVTSRGRQYGLRRDRFVDERRDPEEATRAAARHLMDLYVEFQDWYLAMAAYNSGPLRVRRAIKRSGSRDYWTLTRRRFLPRETRKYVPIILALVYLEKNPQLYELGEFNPAAPLFYDTAVTDSEITLDLAADITGSTVEGLRDLNPALLRSATPPFRYQLRLPRGTGGVFDREIASIPRDKRLTWRRHEVRESDSLAALAKRYRVKESEIVALNHLDSRPLASGLRLTIPTTRTRLRYYRSGGAGGFLEGGTGRYRIARGDTLGGIGRRFRVSVSQLKQWNQLGSSRIIAGRYLIVQPDGVGARGTTARTATARRAGPPPSGKYTVRRGDNLSVIAKRFGVTVAELKSWNGIRGNRIYPGSSLKVPSLGGSSRTVARSAPAAAAPGSGRYRVRRGDNLSGISERFGVTISDLKSWNGLRNSRIRAGKYLVVRPPSGAPRGSAAVSQAARKGTPSGAGSTVALGGEVYRIRRGDNLGAIARSYGVTVSDLKAWNGLRGNRITAGEKLVVSPGGGSGNGATPVRAAAAKPSSTNGSTARSGGSVRYRIRRGDNLAGIAKRHNVTVAELKAWNGLRNSRITAGKYLTIGGGSTRAAAGGRGRASAPAAGGQYRIRQGDTLSTIASRFGVTVQQLKAWNGLRNNRIRAGKYLTIGPANSSNQPSDPKKLAAAGGL